jgi:hypothetical protein
MGEALERQWSTYLFSVELALFLEKSFLAFRMLFIVHTAINGTDRRTLWLVVEPDTFGALVRNDIEKFLALGILFGLSVVFASGRRCDCPLEARAVREAPGFSSFVNGVVGALRLASATIDAFFRDLDRHLGGFRNFACTKVTSLLRPC